MGYYAMGDYYLSGDPGIFGAIGKAVGGVAKLVGGAAKVVGKVAPGPIGAIAGIAGGVLAGGARKPNVLPVATGFPAPMGGQGINLPGSLRVNPLAALPGGKPFITREGGSCPPGYHLNKQDGKYGARGTYCVRNRAMNPLNPRALRRGLRRQTGAVALMRRVLKGSGISIGRRTMGKGRARRR